MNVNYKLPTPLVGKQETIPAKIVDLKVRSTPINPTDINPLDETIKFSMTYSRSGLDQSLPEQFLISINDIETGVTENSIITAKNTNQYLWLDIIGQLKELENGATNDSFNMSNYKITLTPINFAGEGPSSIFFIALKNTIVDYNASIKCSYRSNALTKGWSQFSETPEERKNRPKVIHIYLDVDRHDVEQDVIRLNSPTWKFTGVGNWLTTNQKMYRWLWTSTEQLRLDENGWGNATQPEQDFINSLLKEVRGPFMLNMAERGLQYGDPFVFKLLIQNPVDKLDTIQLYIMKGQRWQL